MKALTGTNINELYEQFYVKNKGELQQFFSNLSTDKGKLYDKACETVRTWLGLRHVYVRVHNCNECGTIYKDIAIMANEQMIKIFLSLTDLL